MTYEPDAVVRHSHILTLGSLWRQHFGYGRGALRFHRARAGAGDGPFKPDSGFYTKLLRAALSQTPRAKAARLTTLLLWTQAANAAGFFYEKFRKASRAAFIKPLSSMCPAIASPMRRWTSAEGCRSKRLARGRSGGDAPGLDERSMKETPSSLSRSTTGRKLVLSEGNSTTRYSTPLRFASSANALT